MSVPALPPSENALSAEVLHKIGLRTEDKCAFGPPVHPDLAVCWKAILKNGLPEEERTLLRQTYPVPENCIFMDPPKLNLELFKAVSKLAQERDARICTKQAKMSACLASLGKALNLVLSSELCSLDSLLEPLSDAARLLADTWHDETMIRRSLIRAHVNVSLKEALGALETDEFLFGSKMMENLKTAKAVDQSVAELKLSKAQPPVTPKNPPAPPRPTVQPPPKMQGGSRVPQHRYRQPRQRQQSYHKSRRTYSNSRRSRHRHSSRRC